MDFSACFMFATKSNWMIDFRLRTMSYWLAECLSALILNEEIYVFAKQCFRLRKKENVVFG